MRGPAAFTESNMLKENPQYTFQILVGKETGVFCVSLDIFCVVRMHTHVLGAFNK